jgi:5-formyltetrahydrofolate cyclo-ligase
MLSSTTSSVEDDNILDEHAYPTQRDSMIIEIAEKKAQLRNKIWTLLEQKGVALFPLPIRDRIPNFVGSDQAANLVRTLPEWEKAKVIFSNPDYAQKKIREFALKEGKILIMASPRLKHGFLRIDPQDVKGREEFASSIKGAFKYGEPAKAEEMPKPDLIITGCVAVDLKGWRLGKGGGYGDVEIKRIKDQFGKIPVVTTIHHLQLVETVPHADHDTKVNIIVTPKKIYRIHS